jgi:putative DNA primase/helicase
LRENPGSINTITVSSGGGGRHYWFRQPEGLDIPSSQGKLAPGIDVRGSNGHIVAPPSRTTGIYQFDTPIDSTPLAEMPVWMIDSLVKTRDYLSKGNPVVVPTGKRHDALMREGLRVKAVCDSVEDLFFRLKCFYLASCEQGDHSVGEDEIRRIAEWVMETGKKHPLTDLGNAERFVDYCDEKVHWCEENKSWYLWTGKHWQRDRALQIEITAHETCRQIQKEESSAINDNEREQIRKHAWCSEGNGRIIAMLENAKPYLAVPMSEFDHDPFELNVQNGILNLKTGRITPHQKTQLFSKLINIPYDSTAVCPRWDAFLSLITGSDQELVTFLKRAVGYSLTGVTDEQCLFFIHGYGRNGKTTFIETLMMITGDYSRKTDMKLLLDDNRTSDKQYAAQLVGVRFATSNEVADGLKFSESVLKDLTGGDQIIARPLYRDPFQFIPSHKLWIYGNYKPSIASQDEGIWRRFRIIPFAYAIPSQQIRPQSTILHEFMDEAPGILAWAVEGCLEWQHRGLTPPNSVLDATSEYRRGEDMIQQFIDDFCIIDPAAQSKKTELFIRFGDWCKKGGFEDYGKRTQKWFTHQLGIHGYTLHGHCNQMVVGIKLKGMV